MNTKKEKFFPSFVDTLKGMKRSQILLLALLAAAMITTDLFMNLECIGGTLAGLIATLTTAMLFYSTLE